MGVYYYLKDKIVYPFDPCNFSSSECQPNAERLMKSEKESKQSILNTVSYPLRYHVTLAQLGQNSSDNTPATGMMSDRTSSKIGGKR